MFDRGVNFPPPECLCSEGVRGRSYNVDVEARFQCAGCGEWNLTAVDESAGRRQSYIEDCQVCCKANLLHVEYDVGEREFVIVAELE